jgi:hypothetical protein
MSSFIQKNEEKNFRQDLQSEFKGFLNEQSRRFHPDNCLQKYR